MKWIFSYLFPDPPGMDLFRHKAVFKCVLEKRSNVFGKTERQRDEPERTVCHFLNPVFSIHLFKLAKAAA